MAILNYDYKIKAIIKPIKERQFTYAIYADVADSNGNQRNEKVYESQGMINSWNDAIYSAKLLSTQTAAELAEDGINDLRAQDPGLVVNKYIVHSSDPFVSTICSEDGQDIPLAWSSELAEEDVRIETQWIRGPQLDTEIHNSELNRIPLTDASIKQLLVRTSLQPMPGSFEVLELHTISDNENVIIEYDDGLYAYAVQMFRERPAVIVADEEVRIVKNTIRDIELRMDQDQGFRPDLISYRIENEKILEVIGVENNLIRIKGLGVGQTTLNVSYEGFSVNPITVIIEPPKPKLTVTKDKEKSFVGDPVELHLNPQYDNGDIYMVQDSSLTLTNGEADIEKVDNLTYRITPKVNDVLSFDAVITSATGDHIQASIKLPVWNKKLYRFHTLPESVEVLKGQEYTITAHYQLYYPEMQHNDDEIKWEIIEGSEFVQLLNTTGKSATIRALGQGVVKIQATAYDSTSVSTLTIKGENEKILRLSPSQLQLAPGAIRTIYAQVVNGDAGLIEWEVKDNGAIKVVKQAESFIQVEALINGTATITAKSGVLTQQAFIEVSENFIQSMAEPTKEEVTTYYPAEDSPEQWTDERFEESYIDGKGMSTILYGRSHGEEDPYYAFKSGIGDNDDLFVKKPESENDIQAFKYAARLRGKKKHQIMIYPEIKFQYSIQYKGDLFVTYNESPFKIGIDAYPAKKFEVKIQEERKLETEREWEVKMDLTGTVTKKTLEYAINWKANIEIEDHGDVKDLFTSSAKGMYIGGGSPDVWRLSADGSYIYETANRSLFSGVIAKEFFNWSAYEVDIDFKPIHNDNEFEVYSKNVYTNTWYRDNGADDDVIGIILKAQPDGKNFYVMFWEAHQMVKGSARAPDNLDGYDIFSNKQNGKTWDQIAVPSSPSWTNSEMDLFETSKGWKTMHRRIYKVVNGKMYRVNTTDLKGGNGWALEKMHSMKVRSIGKKCEVWIKHPDGQYEDVASWYKVFEFDTEWETGSFGICNISQAVEFHGIRLRKWGEINGRIPETGYSRYDGFGEQKIADNATEYVRSDVVRKLDVPTRKYFITDIKSEVANTVAGSCTVSKIDGPITVKTNNPPNAGQPITISVTKKGKQKVTPDNIDINTGAIVFEDVNELFKAEITKFKQDHPEVAASSVTPTFTLIKPASGEPEFDWNGTRLIVWKADPPIETMEKEYQFTVFAYQGWVDGIPLTDFKGGKWATYTLTVYDNTWTVNPKYDAWKWKKSGAVSVHHDPSDVLQFKTTEWYRGTFPADIKNEGIVNSEEKVYVDIPPNHEHYVEPYENTPMPGIFDKVHYILHMYPVGKQNFVWMYWESNPGITTRNVTSPFNVITGKPALLTELQNDRVVVICDPDPRYVPWWSGKYVGYGKVNGKRPFFGDSAGKANMVGVPTDTLFLPPNLVNIEGPFIEVDDPRIDFAYDAFKKTVTFSSDFKDAYIWYTDWYTAWTQDDRSFHADREKVTVIPDTVTINPNDEPDYDSDVFVEKVEVISNNPFVSVWAEKKEGDTNGLLATYYRYPQDTKNIKEGFVVGGDFRIREQTFVIEESVTGHQENGQPAAEAYLPGEMPIRGTIPAKEVREVHTVYVPAGTPVLKVLGSFMVGTGNQYPDLMVTAPNGEQFGIIYNNGTWSSTPITITQFSNGQPMLSCSEYQFSGDASNYEAMSFKNPKDGHWKIRVYNQGIQDTDYMISTNMGTSPVKTIMLAYAPDPWNVKVYVNGIETPDFTLNRKELIISAPINQNDVVRIEYTAGGYSINELPMQSEFTIFDEPPYRIMYVRKNGVDIPESTTNGYTLEGKTFKINGSYLTPGEIKIKYAVGRINNVFTLANEHALGTKVYLNGVVLEDTKYSISGNTLVIDPDLLMPKDWVHIQSYKVVSEFDPAKENYLGEFAFSRIDPFINFDWGTQSPFTEMENEVRTAAASFKAMEVIPDQMKFDFNIDMEITYPSSEPVDTTNFTGTWSQFNEDPNSRGDWHGPPESGYTKVTNLANQAYRSGWYNPDHKNFTDYSFSFKVQEVNSGDDDMYGALFRFNPDTLSFYSFEMDAAVSRGGSGGTGVKGMAIYRNICTNPTQYGITRLSYNKVQIAHLPEGWTYGANEIHEIKIQVSGRTIRVMVDGVEKFNVVDESPDALLQGAWGPLTQSQPNTYFWDFESYKLMQQTYVQDPGFRHSVSKTMDKLSSDTVRTQELQIKPETMQQEFQADIDRFLASKGLTMADIFLKFYIKNDNSDFQAYFHPGSATITSDVMSQVFATVITKPITAPPKPAWLDFREINRGYMDPDTPIDAYSPDQPEPYIDPIIPPPDNTPNDGFAVNWRGNIYAPVSGTYTFYATADDGFKLWINRQLVIDEWHDSPGYTYAGSIYLEGGKWYDFAANYYENSSSAMVKLEWVRPGMSRSLITSEFFAPYLGYTVNAKVREATPMLWSPMIHNGYYYFNEKEHYLYAKKIRHIKTPVAHQILIQPRPQQGAPIIVRDNEGNNLRKVAFYEEVFDEAGRLVDVVQTLENTETFNGNGFSKYYLQYKDIDPDTFSVKVNGVTLLKDDYVLDPKKSSIQFMKNLGFDDIIECKYKLMYSYYVDYNHDQDNDVAKIVLHSKYDPEKFKDMEIIYEGDAMSPYYRAEEVSFNPILTHNHRGFLYITNKLEDQPKSVEINVSPKTLPANGIGKVLVTGKVLDKYNNPIQNKHVAIYRDGELVYSGPTNRAGEVYLYDKPIVNGDLITKYQIICDDLNNLALLNYYIPDVQDRYYVELKTSKAAVMAGQNDTATVTITLRDENWGVVRGEQLTVSYKDTKGVTRSFRPVTNDYGQASITVSGLDQEQGVFAITASYDMGGENASSFIFLKVIGA
jgi:hypothetical protein